MTYPPPNPFVVPEEHPNREAHKWVADRLSRLDWNSEVNYWWGQRQSQPLLVELDEQTGPFQIAVLKACLERMRWHRQQGSAGQGLSVDYYVGSVLYTIACALYRKRLPYSQDDVCQVLGLSQHSCGHGSDVTPPFDIAVKYARTNGLTAELMSALRQYMDGLKSVGSAQVNHLKRKGGLFFVLDSESTGNRKKCWSDNFRNGLLTLPSDEQARWRLLVLNMTVNDVYVLPKTWRQEAIQFVQELSPALIVQRLTTWWPNEREKTVWPIQTGGSHLLKYFVWLLNVTGAMCEMEPQCIALVCRLSELDWKPRERAQKVVIAAASYLSSFPPELSWPALQRFAQWSELAPDGAKGNKIQEILRTYSQHHKL